MGRYFMLISSSESFNRAEVKRRGGGQLNKGKIKEDEDA